MKGIILIGKSLGNIEKELNMGKQIFTAAGFDIEEVDINEITVIAGGHFKGELIVGGRKMDCPDFAIVGTMEEWYSYHSQAVLRMLESLGVLCINSIETMQMASDKLLTFQIASRVVPEVKIPKTVLVTKETKVEEIEELTGYPLVLKVMHGSMGKGICLVHNEKELERLLSMLFAASFGDQIIAQQAIMSSSGRDLRLLVAGGEVVHTFVRRNDGHFKSNVKQGGYIEDYKAPDHLISMSEKLARALDLKIGSVDYLFGEKEGEYYLCEANSMPGMTYLFDAQKRGDKKLIEKVMSVPGKLLAGHPVPEWRKNSV